jgi:hypothetical protein
MKILEKAGVGGEFPAEEVRPVHGAAGGGVVHVGVADAPVAGEEHVAGVRQPGIGVRIGKETRFGNAGEGVGRNGRMCGRDGCAVEETAVGDEKGERCEEKEGRE